MVLLRPVKVNGPYHLHGGTAASPSVFRVSTLYSELRRSSATGAYVGAEPCSAIKESGTKHLKLVPFGSCPGFASHARKVNRPDPKRAGQAMVFLLMALVILVFAVLWNFDIHSILALKAKTQNAGDSAALMAARWQGISLNLVGDMNIMQAVAISEGDTYTVQAISNVQARLCYTGPMVAFAASQQAAKNNGMYRNEDYEDNLREHVHAVRYDYPHRNSDGVMLFPEPYPGCWGDYANMLESVLEAGIAAGPDNASLYTDRGDNHVLLNRGFYDAVAGRNWCWFYNNGQYGLLQDYSSYRDWPPLPPTDIQPMYMNSEIFSLRLTKWHTTLESLTTDSTGFMDFLNEIAEARELGVITTNAMVTNATWYSYGSGSWGAWDAMETEGADRFPITGPVRPQYDYSGADAAIRIHSENLTLLTPDQPSQDVLWTAAAKPFGFLNDNERPNTYGLVLPAYHQVALVPVDSVSGGGGGAYDLEWRNHCDEHLDPYLARGVSALTPGCYYCQQLKNTPITWEDRFFRLSGVTWLSSNAYLCTLPSRPGGGSRGGGTRRGH